MAGTKTANKDEKVAVVLIRGLIDINHDIKDTLRMLNLDRKHTCTVWSKTPVTMGMIKKVKDYVTFGTISEETFKEMVSKRGEEYNGRITDSKGKIQYNKFFEADGKKYKNFFRLAPPRGGFERGGIKKPFRIGGVLGDRKEKINELLKKMI